MRMERGFVFALALAIAMALGSVLTVAPAAAGDAKAGEKVFKKCKACHRVDGKHRVGPSLKGFFGRNAGTAEGFKYSADMKAAGEAGLVWNDETFLLYMEKTKTYIGSFIDKKKARTRMAFNGLKKATQREDLLAYLKEATR